MTQESKGSHDTLNKIHRLISSQLANRLEDQGVTTADIRAAIEWMAKNNWTAPQSNPGLNKLAGKLDAIDPDRIREIVNVSPSYN